MWVRPAIGLPPGEERRLLARALTRDVRTGEAITEKDVA
jgi:sialic acid synthase SpsE